MVKLHRSPALTDVFNVSAYVVTIIAVSIGVLTASSEARDLETTNCFAGDTTFSQAKQTLNPWIADMTETIKSHQSDDLNNAWQKPLYARVTDAVHSRLDVERAIFWFGIDNSGHVQDLTLSLSTGRPMVDLLLQTAIINSSPFKLPPRKEMLLKKYRIVTVFQNDGQAISVSSELAKETPLYHHTVSPVIERYLINEHPIAAPSTPVTELDKTMR